MEEIVQNYKNVFLKWSDFQGRSRRREFWFFVLANFLVSVVFAIIDSAVFHKTGGGPLQGLYSLVALVPGLALSFRRLHDIGKSAWWILISLIPIIGWLVILYFYVKDSDAENIYGPNPKLIS